MVQIGQKVDELEDLVKQLGLLSDISTSEDLAVLHPASKWSVLIDLQVLCLKTSAALEKCRHKVQVVSYDNTDLTVHCHLCSRPESGSDRGKEGPRVQSDEVPDRLLQETAPPLVTLSEDSDMRELADLSLLYPDVRMKEETPETTAEVSSSFQLRLKPISELLHKPLLSRWDQTLVYVLLFQ
jgi:hypothetical protein